MGVRIVMDGQFGSCGKGAMVAWLAAREQNMFLVVRTGGPNAGHSMLYDGATFKMRHVPCAWHNPLAVMALGPGAVVDVEHLLHEEIPMVERALGDKLRGRFFVDPMTVVIEPDHRYAETALVMRVGSTGEGVGAATAERVMRRAKLADNVSELSPYITDVSELVQEFEHGPIIIEGTQGYGLSLTRSGFYPFCTSRDITPAQLLNDAAVPSQFPHEVMLVMRTYPIRVAGNSGPLLGELTWEQLSERTGGYVQPERTTVTNKIRRVGEWDIEWAKRAVQACRPVGIALTFYDYLRPDLAGGTTLDSSAYQELDQLGVDLGCPVRWVSLGFGNILEV